jgi:DNA-binding beta-propeller fold protein YncE
VEVSGAMRRFGRWAIGTAVMGLALTAAAPALAQGVSLSYVGRAISGDGPAGAEIAAYSPDTKRLFVTNGATKKIDIFSLANPASPTKVSSVTLSGLGDLQSVATNGSLVAVAAYTDATDGKYLPGRVIFMNTNGTIDPRAPQGVAVGALPDSVHFAPDGKTVVVANEGEPKTYCQTAGEFVDANDPKGSVSIIDTSAATLTATTLEFTSFNAQAASIRSAGGRIYGPGADVDQDLEPEYVAISDDSKTAYVTLQENNAVAEINLATKTITRIMGLGYKDHSGTGKGLDPSDQTNSTSSADQIAIATVPVKGMYQPDAIQTFADAAGTQYFVTANEGDAREYGCILDAANTGANSDGLQAEDARFKDLDPDETILTIADEADARLGRLTVTRFAPSGMVAPTSYGGSTYAANASKVSELYAFGARSISIFKAPSGAGIGAATLVGDTGDVIEQKTAVLLPQYRFNADWATGGTANGGSVGRFDVRSDNKGPEPEGLALANAFGKTLAFVGLERVGGVMVFDISNPASPTYLDYLNTSIYSGNFVTGKATAAAGDVSPEGIQFVRASDSPTGKPALIVAYELSGTTAIFNVNGTAIKPGAPTGVTATAAARTATVSWTAPKQDGGGAILGYVVTSKPGGYTCTTDASTSCTYPSLPLGRAYTFTVTARNLAGDSPASSASAQITTNTFRPAAVSDITLRAGASSIQASWTRPSDRGGSAITNYIATAVPGGKRCETTGRSCTIEGLAPGRAYGVRVVAINAAGQSEPARADRVRVGFTQGRTTIARESPLAVRWLVETGSTGKVVARVVSGDCTVTAGRVTATGPVGSACVLKVSVGASASHTAQTREITLVVREPRDFTDLFARARRG